MGGIYSCLDRSGKVYSTDKSVWAQGRAAYVFAKLARTYRETSLTGTNGSNFQRAASIFSTNTASTKATAGCMFTVTEEGNPLRKRRYFF